MKSVELRIVRPLPIDYGARAAIVDAFRAELVALARFRLDAPPCAPLACLSAADLLARTERSPRRPPRVGPTHVLRAHAPTSGLRVELQLRASPDGADATDPTPVPFLRVRGTSRELLEAALPKLALAFQATEAFIVAALECPPPAAKQTVVALTTVERPSYLVPQVMGPSTASSTWVLEALRSARGDDDPLVRSRYADPSPEGRARLHVSDPS